MTNEDNMKAAQAALEKQKIDEYTARLNKKREERLRVSAVGINNPFDIPEEFLDKRFHYMIVNDAPGRVNSFQRRGYDLVNDKSLSLYLNQKEGTPVKFATGMKEPAWAYLMRIEKELYEEDMAAEKQLAENKMKALSEAPENLKFAKDAQVDGVELDKSETLAD